MQEVIPYATHLHAASSSGNTSAHAKTISKAVSDNAVAVLGRRACCMSIVLKALFVGHGVKPAMIEVEEVDEADVVAESLRINGGKGEGSILFPAAFVGGKLFGGLDQVMATHISGDLVPILKAAGALWL